VRSRWISNLLKENNDVQSQLLLETDVTRVTLLTDKVSELKKKLHEEESSHHVIDTNKTRLDNEYQRVKAQTQQLHESVRVLEAELRQAQTPEHWAQQLERRYLGEHATRVIEPPVTPKRLSSSPTRDSMRTDSPKSGDSSASYRAEDKHSPKRDLTLLAGTASLSERKRQLFQQRDEMRAAYTERASLNATLVPFREVIPFVFHPHPHLTDCQT